MVLQKEYVLLLDGAYELMKTFVLSYLRIMATSLIRVSTNGMWQKNNIIVIWAYLRIMATWLIRVFTKDEKPGELVRSVNSNEMTF